MIERVINAAIWSIVEKWTRILLGLATLVILARLLPPEAFGVVAAAYLFIELSEVFMSQGLGFAIVQRAELEPEHLHTAFWINVITAIVLATLLVAAAPLAAAIIGDPKVTPVLRWMSVIMPVNALTRVPLAVLTRDLSFKSIGVRTLIQTVASSGVAIAMAIAGFGVWSLVGQQATRAAVGFATLWWATDYRPRFVISFQHWSDLWPFSWRIVLDQIVLFISRRVDEAVVAMLLGAAALGVYTVAKRIALMLLGGFGGAINAVALPSFARVQHDRERMRRATTEGLRLTSAVIFPAMIGLAAISPEAIPALFGSQWKDATTPGVIIALAGIMSVFPTVLHSAYHGLGRPGIPLRLNVVRAIGALIFVPLLAPWGLTGIAAAYLVRDALAAGADMYPMKRLLKVRYMMIAEALAPIAMASTLMAFIVRVVASLTPLVPAIWQLLTMIATGALVYGAVVAIADRPTFRFFRETITTRVSRASRRQKSTA